MEIKFKKIALFIAIISSVSYSAIIFQSYYNSSENIENRCISKFQREINNFKENYDEEWGLNMDIAYENYFKCMKIP